MTPRVYLETTIPSYLTARPSRVLLAAARQQVTRDWWDRRRADFELVVSRLVLDECGDGDPDAAAARLAVLVGLPELAQTEAAVLLGQDLLTTLRLPSRATADAFHIATAAIHGVEYLLT